jgi:hypothetical protein
VVEVDREDQVVVPPLEVQEEVWLILVVHHMKEQEIHLQ